ncbi:formate/nitrite transporter family protein [Eubacterium oxidoreducens]|uniref:Formate/nitrite transporter n=1 Tax=Eubacterium oxidoreducens TaxID=1732 RepID=A0A1G6CIN1_EUBOX|nr:formate/nitrite transporter family protein [Eubacterium oxidoreducens]SDB32788.1 formate/nitrite transporter [Eubacterium oxidoreducens]
MINSPAEVAKNYVAIGKGKANLSIAKMIFLGLLAGMFIGFAAVGATTVGSTVDNASLAKFLGAVVFPGGLAMVLIAGSELFTGNCLLIIPLLQKEITVGQMIKNWVFVWIGNLAGGILVSLITVGGHQANLFSNQLAVSYISTAVAKTSMTFGDAFMKGIGCNFLVCIAVWMAFAAKSVGGKIIGLYFPIMLFVLEGFEHSVANMQYISIGLLCKLNDTWAQAATDAGVDFSNLTWGAMFGKNLLPVSLGNIVGGLVLVGLIYWGCYLKGTKKEA